MKLNLLFFTTLTFAAMTSVNGAPATSDADKRAENLINQMTLEEKIDYIGGTGFTIRAIPRLGIPEIVMSDGPMGCRGFGRAASFPAGISLAASWNRDLAREIGIALGRESRARGVHILLAPGVNIYKSPLCGRNFEYLGEDPFLASKMVVPLIKGIQSQEVLATVKHYACNNQEWDRHSISSEVDERTLREIYLPAFKAAVQEADSGCLMTAYNLLNGVHCSQSDYLIRDILQKEWGFDGIIMSDWVSTYDAVAAANAGLDLEMPTGELMNRKNLIPAIQAGLVKESVIDEKVRRILRTVIAAGFMDRTQVRPEIPKDDPKSTQTALKGARESIVLLKNDHSILPLNKSKIKRIAVVGPNADPAVYCAGGSAFTTSFHPVSIADGIRKSLDKSVEIFRPLMDLGFVDKAHMEIFNNREFKGEPVSTMDVDHIKFNWNNEAPAGLSNNQNFSVRWTGKIRPSRPGKYSIITRSDDGVRLYLDGKLIVDDWTEHGVKVTDDAIQLEDREYDIQLEYFQGGGESIIDFEWRPYATLEDTAEKFKDYDAIIYCAGFNQSKEGEGFDRPFELPVEQVDEIRAYSRVNHKTIVVLNSGGGVAWDGWLDNVPALLQAWYSGEMIGQAVAEIIFGDVNPSGKLPATFGKRLEDHPSSPYYHINDNKKTPYTEGIFTGYRGYDKNKTKPEFCFGYGLSYTTFKFDDLTIKTDGSGDTRTIKINCRVTNTGKRTGSEVVQLYAGDPKCSVPRPIRELKGFEKVTLKPGETIPVSFILTKDDLAFYDIQSHSWVTEPGRFEVWAGSSSRDLPLHGEFDW